MRAIISAELEKKYLGIFLDLVADRFDAGRPVRPIDLIEVQGREVTFDDLLRAIRLHEPLGKELCPICGFVWCGHKENPSYEQGTEQES